MLRIPVLVFQTDPASHERLHVTLTRRGVAHTPCLVPLKKGTVPPSDDCFLRILERHHPQLLIMSWRYIGPAVRRAEQTMADPRPVEKWIVSGYSTQELEKQAKVSGWADMIYRTPVSLDDLDDFGAQIEQFFQRISSRNLVRV